MTASMRGRSTFTATSRPDFRVAKCTCAIDALATGSASKLAKTSSMRRPKAFSTSARASRAGNGGTRSCSLASSSAMSSGSRSRRVDSTWPNLTKIGPSRSSARRRRTPRGSSRRRPTVATRTIRRTQRWRNADSATSSSPKRRTVKAMKTRRARCRIERRLRCAAAGGRAPGLRPAARCAARAPAPSPAGAVAAPPPGRKHVRGRRPRPSAGSAAAS